MKERAVPKASQHVIKVSIRQDLVAWWETHVEPVIDKRYGGNRSAFIVDAVREFVDKYASVRKKGS